MKYKIGTTLLCGDGCCDSEVIDIDYNLSRDDLYIVKTKAIGSDSVFYATFTETELAEQFRTPSDLRFQPGDELMASSGMRFLYISDDRVFRFAAGTPVYRSLKSQIEGWGELKKVDSPSQFMIEMKKLFSPEE